ncbi:MurR/RpiR family transcriptional regulator [Coprobacillus sp. AF13-15]|jgi:DNA-binding MurR/RpiR family transcriptional regulator|uniref:MurR/RpiR family transcriptional regulator n=1 Tax=Faecalibacillus intestinalis TaxID=1982626 RepID=A0AAW4VNV9_9FIRM|nr:MurR/RpiR family transcriptional regulator [Faecalibacillus intestinalis]RGF60292.1 MurR/RpiR family transcriptional regulator [Coprobacillus sp. AF36-10BH]RGG32262.1 MurR/RpiR family transcriptional regulator [Coprobacillus sp. AF24-1LB]RHO29863.1 MurR/RpiR family transcriptional regulator [Coprobacillus sp. AM17-34]RHS08128.1 MurR/RpiR family transcriptional regulator [Coprobacillus sp. AF13-4LB]RHS16201.1 MurR/RpiR family transcriptional regulator [Coprobacillus sp. AF13-15]RHS19034.1 M
MDLFTKIKAMNSFTESEQTFIDFIFNHPYDVIQLNLQQLSKTSYVSISTIYRVMEKLEINGLNQLKLQISESLKNNENLKNIDYNYPFQKTNTHYQILTQMLELYDQTLKNTINLIDLDVLLHTVQALKKANNIYIFPSIGNYFMAESFQQNMLEIGVKVDVIKEAYYQHWHVQLCDENDIVMLISYAGRTPQIMDIVHDLNKKNIPIILISSTIHTPIDQFAKYHLYFSSYEDSEEKIASFSSRISLQYLLDCIYACYFNRDYEKNLEYKIKNYID